jgi:signal transduction histidine kinase/CheY-like chemotaxis protein
MKQPLLSLRIPVILCLLFSLFYTQNSHSQYVFARDKPDDKISLHPFTSIANVGEKNLRIDAVIKDFESLHPRKLCSENDDLGFTKDHFWTKTTLRNATDTEFHYYLETARPVTDLAELYILDNDSHKITKSISGDAIPYANRTFDDRRTVFKIDIAPHANLSLFLHLKSDGEVIKMPVTIRNAESFIRITAMEQWIFGIFYGILLTAAILYFFFFFALKERTFLYYSLYVVFIGLMQFALDGYFYQLITPGGGWFSMHAVLIFAMIAGFLLGRYSQVFLGIKKHSRFIGKIFDTLYVLALILILTLIFVPSAFAICYPLANVLGLLILVMIIVSVVYMYWKKIPVDPFFSIGILFLILGFGIFILNNFGQIPNSFVTLNSSKIGTGLEIIFLSLSMGNLIRNLKNEKEELNRLALVRSEEMNELKSYFLSNISHELRTPLNAIMNLIDSIAKETKDDKIKRDCQVIKYSSHSLLSSVNDILDFSKIEKGELQLEKVDFEPVKVLEHLKNNAANRAKDQGLEFDYSKADGIPEMCHGDVTRLVQIVNNVLSNAIKFTQQGKVSFRIESQPKPNNRTQLKLIISDTGIGISKDKLLTIFDSFTQDNIDNKRKFGGLGLGLYIVKTLVDMQRGDIKLESKVGEGTTCTIKLDFDVVEKKIEEVPAEMVFDLGGKNILVAEDNAINQMVIKMITKKWLNTTVSYANNGQEALDWLAKEKFDIILMDLQMPVMDGYEATIAIREGKAGADYASIPIVAVTADVMETTKLRVKEIGMNHYLSKPLKNELLYKVVRDLL